MIPLFTADEQPTMAEFNERITQANADVQAAIQEAIEGGLVWAGIIDINPQQVFDVTIGQGGSIGQAGTATVFGQYSSANGQNFSPNYTDIASGDAFARDGVAVPAPNTGDGGAGGAGGIKGNTHEESSTDEDGWTSTWTVIDNYPGEGQPGKPGASGCVVVYWDKEAS